MTRIDLAVDRINEVDDSLAREHVGEGVPRQQRYYLCR
jgi:hypothetical protein